MAASLSQIPIPRIYYEALENALQAQVKRLARDISSRVHQSEQPFLKHLASQKIGIYLFDEADSELLDIQAMRCAHYIAHPESPSLLIRCNEPILLGSQSRTACPHHCAHPNPSPPSTLKQYRLINEGIALYWVDSENTLFTIDLKACGTYNPQRKTCKKFVKIEETNSTVTSTAKNGVPSL